MDKLKFALFSVVVLALVGILGYWSVATIQSGSEHAKSEKIKELENVNEELRNEIQSLNDELDAAETKLEGFAIKIEEQQEEDTTESGSTPPANYKNQTLINELEKLVKDNIFMKEKSLGTRVGTVQKFLNLYNKTSKTVDNDYGPGTKTDVQAFQKAEGLTADGEAGPNTFKKMIDWLKKQG